MNNLVKIMNKVKMKITTEIDSVAICQSDSEATALHLLTPEQIFYKRKKFKYLSVWNKYGLKQLSHRPSI